jgi:hypothetical protein
LIANGGQTVLPLIEIDLTKNNYTNNVSDTLLIQADFQTFLEKYSITQGSYGLKVVVLYDNDEKYYSTDLYNFNLKSELVDKIELINIKKVTTY